MQTKTSYLHTIIENLNDAVYTTDLSGTFTWVNPAAEKLTGYSSKEFNKINVSKIVSPNDLELVKTMIQQKINKNIPTIYEIEIIKKDGKQIPVEISSRAIYENGRATGILGIARDITERKALEQQKEIFFSLITHEIKTPLTSIKAFSELLNKKTKGKKQQNYSAMIIDQVNKLTMLINDFLDISKMDTGKFAINKQKFDIGSLINNIINSFETSAKTHTIINKSKNKTYVNADKNRIEQVITNLISNALKYSPRGETITIASKKTKKEILISVTDRGQGIPKESRRKIFDLFYRLNNHKQAKIKGHGLGLYICKQIILEHKGKIWIESKINKGARFIFSLPIK